MAISFQRQILQFVALYLFLIILGIPELTERLSKIEIDMQNLIEGANEQSTALDNLLDKYDTAVSNSTPYYVSLSFHYKQSRRISVFNQNALCYMQLFRWIYCLIWSQNGTKPCMN